ncbi:MAG: hypothetical protein GY731_15625, partial [Gammaproteobacteria bacterium]|nr:hypothetical protein [Gammaproteobacteria bacterium]
MDKARALVNPFVGLRPFESEDSLYFFGREDQTKALLRQLHQHRFVAVVGSSGSGKSSLIRAGLIPKLEAGFLVQDRDRWRVAVMKPGDKPVHNLASALIKATGGQVSQENIHGFSGQIHRQGAQVILERVRTAMAGADANLLLLVDQFEEVFRFQSENLSTTERDEVADLITVILRLSEQREIPIYVCTTMRSDFIGDCDAFHGLPEAMNRSQYLVPRLTHAQRRNAITAPVHLAGGAITRRLVDRILNENVGTWDDLPILQHALMRTWNQWDQQGAIDTEHYQQVGTVHGALNKHADEAYEELGAVTSGETATLEQTAAKHLFQSLTKTDAGSRRVRRPVHLSEVAETTGVEPTEIMQVIRRFRIDDRDFLVLSDTGDDPLIDISHESLIRQWSKLNQWLDTETESVKIYRRLAETAALHKDGKAGFYHDPDLQRALDWRESDQPTAAWARRYPPGFHGAMEFLDESRGERERLRQERERAEAMEREAVEKARALRRTRWFLVVLACFLAGTLVAVWYAVDARN